jgi:quinol monooxygenase YgiN
MSEPIVFISNQRIKEGKLDEYTQAYRQVAELTEANKPGTVAHLAYVNEDGTEMSIVHVFPDAESMELHMQGVDELAKKAFQFMEIVSFEIYGKPSDTVLETMKKIVGSGVTLNIKPQPIGGYIRLNSGWAARQH